MRSRGSSHRSRGRALRAASPCSTTTPSCIRRACRDRAGTNSRSPAARAGTAEVPEATPMRRPEAFGHNIRSPMSETPVATPARTRFRTVAAEGSIPIDADDLVALARRYADQGMYDEAIHLYEMAEKLKPGSVAVRINLARARDLKAQAEASRYEAVRQDVDAQRARDEVDA